MNAKTILEEECRLALEQRAKRDDLQQFACCRMDAATVLTAARDQANRTEKEIRQIRKRLEALPQVEAYAPLRRVLDVYIRHAIEDWVEPPPVHQLPKAFETRTTDEALAMVLLEEQITKKELLAVAYDYAVELHPEKFSRGYSDREIQQKRIAEIEQQLRETMSRAANSWGLDDVEFHSGVCTFRLSQGRVAVGGGPGDVHAIEQLLNWMWASQHASVAPEQESEGEVIDFNSGEVRRV